MTGRPFTTDDQKQTLIRLPRGLSDIALCNGGSSVKSEVGSLTLPLPILDIVVPTLVPEGPFLLG